MSLETQNEVAPSLNPEGTVPPQPDVKEEKQLSPKWAEVVRREKMVRERQRQMEAQKKAWEEERLKKEEEYKTSYIPKSRLKDNFLEAAYEAGLTQDQLVNMILNGQPQVDPTVRALQQELEQIKTRQQKALEEQEAQTKKNYDDAISRIRSSVEQLVTSSDEYDTIREYGDEGREAVVSLIEQTYKEEGRVLSEAEACKKVEDYLIDQGLKFSSFKKVKARLTPQEAQEIIEEASKLEEKNPASFKVTPKKTPVPQEKNLQNQNPIKTLTNAGTPSTSRPLSPRERAILAFEGKLQK